MNNYLIVLIIASSTVLYGCSLLNNSTNHDELAKCLTSKGVKFYGAFWCPHCAEQKDILGSSMKYINYVECSTPDGNSQTPICKAANIISYPTWEFPTGLKESGVHSLDQLASKSGCPLNGTQ